MVSATDARLQSEARQDAADLLARSVRSCLCRQVCDRRHQRHLRRCSSFLALNKIKGGTLENIDPGIEAIKPIAKGSAGALHPGRSAALAVRARRDRRSRPGILTAPASRWTRGCRSPSPIPKEGAVGILPAVVIPKGTSKARARAQVHRPGAFGRRAGLLLRARLHRRRQHQGEALGQAPEDRALRRNAGEGLVHRSGGRRQESRRTGRVAGSAKSRAELRLDGGGSVDERADLRQTGQVATATSIVVSDVSLTIKEGEFVSLLGPSGCGKTTILRMVAGLVEPSRGRILIGDDDVTALPPNKRGLGLVFQSYALFPHLTVFENVAFGLRRRKVAGAELDRRVKEALAMRPACRFRRALSAATVRRAAAARRHRAGARAASARAAVRRAALQSRCAASRRDADRTQAPAARARHHHALRHPRPGRGALDVGPRRRDGEGRHAAVRDARGYLSSPRDRFRRRASSASRTGFRARSLRATAAGGSLRLGAGLELPAAHVEQPEGAKVDVVIRQEAVRLRSGRAETGALAGTVALRSFSGARVQYVVQARGWRRARRRERLERAGLRRSLSAATVSLAIDPRSVFAMPAEEAAA